MAGVVIPQYNYGGQYGGATTPYKTPAQQQAEALKKQQEAEAFQTQQQQQQTRASNTAQSGYDAGRGSAGYAGTATRSAANTSQLTGAGYSVDPTGLTNFNDDAEQARISAAESDARRLATLRSLMGQYGSTGRADAPDREQHRGLSINGNEEAARAAAFGRAKDQTGLITRGAVDSLRSLYAGSGNAGAQRQGLENIVESGAGRLGEFTRDQLMSDLAREAEVSDMTYQGGITQRGQDINRPFNPQLQALISLMGTIY